MYVMGKKGLDNLAMILRKIYLGTNCYGFLSEKKTAMVSNHLCK